MPGLANLEKLIGTPRDGALLRYSLGIECRKLGERARAIGYFRDATERDPLYSAAWKALGKALQEDGRVQEALGAYRKGIGAARQRGDKQAEKEMALFARRIDRAKP